MNKLNLIILLFVCLCFACSQTHEEEPKAYPTLTSVATSDISDTGVTFTSSLSKATEADISDHGFVWSTDSKTIFSSSDQLSLGTASELSTFTTRLNTRLREGQRYYVRSFVEIDELRVLSDTVSFVSSGSQGPELISFKPKIANVGDNITLIGKGFSSQIENNIVSFGDHKGLITKSTLDTILVVVPEQLTLEKSEIKVEVAGEVSTYGDLFQLFRPSINQLNSTQFIFGDTIEIQTDNPVPTLKSQIQIALEYENGNRAEIEGKDILLSPLRFIVPFNISANQFKVILRYNGFETTSTESLQLAPPIISELSKTELKYGDVLKVVSSSFSPIRENNKIYLGEVQLQLGRVSVTPDNRELSFVEVRIPTPLLKAYSARSLPIRVEVLGIEGFSDYNVEITNKWFRLRNPPFQAFDSGLSYDQIGYVYTNNQILSYRPDQDEWENISTFPGESRSHNAFFALSDKIYLGLGKSHNNSNSYFKDIWQYSIENRSWEQLNDFPGSNRLGSVSFGFESSGYVGLGYRIRENTNSGRIYLNEFWSFNPTNLSWTRISDYPIMHWKSSYGITRDGLFIGTQEGLSPPQFYKYIPQTDQWDYITSFPGGFRQLQDIAVGYLKDKPWLYFFANTTDGSSQGVDEYDTETQMWTSLERSTIDKTHIFNINGKMYFLSKVFGNQLWEFDPNQN